MQSVDEVIPYLEKLKISALRKAELIKNDVHNITIGPNSSPPKPREDKVSTATKSSMKNNTSRVTKSSQEILPIRQIFKEYEVERQRQVRADIESHEKKFEEFETQQHKTMKQQWLFQQQKFIQSMQYQEMQILQHALKRFEDNKSRNSEKMNLHYQELEENRRRTASALEAKKRERELLKECVDNQGAFLSMYQDIVIAIKNCKDEKLKVGLTDTWKQCKELYEMMVILISKCKETVCIEKRNEIVKIVKRTAQLKNDINELISKSEELKRQQQAMKEAENRKSPPFESTSSQSTVEAAVPKALPIEKPKETASASSLDNYVSKVNFRWYSEVIDFQEKYLLLFKELLNDDRLKPFRFDCKKAVNLSVNAISAVNPQHLRDKYIKLSNLLQGQNVVIGDFQISASRYPRGIPFCTDLLAKKFVLQGDLMISANPEAAFSYATIIVSLWNESPDLGKMLLAYFFKECPYLVPFYIPKSVDQTDEEFYKSQGYRYTDGVIEKQDKFLKRMTGIMRLYFAILISSPKKGQNGNSHDIKVAWTWFVSVLKLQPRLDITATMLHTFLETVGFEMQNTYRMQFFKLLRFFVEQYFPSLKKIDSGGPVTRLECLIQEFKENRNQFKPPNGILSKNFW